MAKKHKAIPKGLNYAHVLADEKRKRDALAQAQKEIEIRAQSEMSVHRALWLSAISIADAYGFGPKRLALYFEKLEENAKEFEHMVAEYDYEYALEKLRVKAEKATGSKLGYLPANGMFYAGKEEEGREPPV